MNDVRPLRGLNYGGENELGKSVVRLDGLGLG